MDSFPEIRKLHLGIFLFLGVLLLLAPAPSAQKTVKPIATSLITEIRLTPERQAELDSLKNVLKNAPPGQDKIKAYGKICWFLIGQSQLHQARRYADTVQVLANKWNDDAGKIKATYYYGVLARQEGNYAAALPYLERYISFYQHRGDSSKLAGGLFQLGSVHTNMGNFEKGLAAYYRYLAIEAADSNWYSVGYTLNTIGVVQKETMRYSEAEKTLYKALHIFDSLNETKDKLDVLGNLGNLYTETGRLKEAMAKYREALHLSRSVSRRRSEAYTLANLAFLFDKMGQYDSALVYHLEALAIREQLPHKENLARSLFGVGLGYGKVKNYALAKKYLARAQALVREIGARTIQRDIYEIMAGIAAEEGDFKKAYDYQQLYTSVKDSILNEESSQQLNELQTRYETAEKDKRIVLLAKEKELQLKEIQRQMILRKASVGGMLLLGFLAILLFYIFRQRLKSQRLLAAKNDEVKEANFRRQMSELEMKALRAQINPHFLFNCMNAINRMILQGEMEAASHYLTKFSKLVRLILENTEASKVSLENELALLEAYIQLEALRFNGKIRYHISVAETIEPENTYLPSMVLQPFVENAIWHGLMHKERGEGGYIAISVKEDAERLWCTIEDNGVGREKAMQLREKSVLKSRSLGIQITEERLRLLGSAKEESLVHITDLKDGAQQAVGTRVEINIPLS